MSPRTVLILLQKELRDGLRNRWLWLSAATGGLLFGFGMVLASGCGSKTLVRVGGGSLKSLVVFLVLGISAFATLKGITAVVRVATVDSVVVEFTQPALLPAGMAAAIGTPLATAGLIAFLAGLLLLTAWGGAGLWLLGDTPEPKDLVIKLYLPWQLIFAFFLSALLRPSPKRGEATATAD